MTFRVGLANDPKPEDPRYTDEREAIGRGQRMHDAYGFYQAVAVWDERDEPCWIFILGEQFRRV